MKAHWFVNKKCPICGRRMYTDGNNWYCSNGNCGADVEPKNQRRSKKPWGKRTAYDRDHYEQERDE